MRRADRHAQRGRDDRGAGLHPARHRRLRHRLLHGLLVQPRRRGRSRRCTVGPRRWRPGSSGPSRSTIVFTVQGDGDMVNEGLQEVLHTAARGESITCVLLNNGVFGETGGHMTATTVLGQRTKNTLDGRDAESPRLPDPDLRPPGRARGRRLRGPRRGQLGGQRGPDPTRCSGGPSSCRRPAPGFTFVEILTMCPTGWFIETNEAPDYLDGQAGGGAPDRRPQGRGPETRPKSAARRRRPRRRRGGSRCGSSCCGDLLAVSAQRVPRSSRRQSSEAGPLTYAELEDACRQLTRHAGGARHPAGRPGGVVGGYDPRRDARCSSRWPDWVPCCVPVNPRATPEEAEQVLARADPDLVVTDESHRGEVALGALRAERVVTGADSRTSTSATPTSSSSRRARRVGRRAWSSPTALPACG